MRTRKPKEPEETLKFLQNTKFVNYFWLSETMERCQLLDDWIARGELILKPLGFPISEVIKAPKGNPHAP